MTPLQIHLVRTTFASIAPSAQNVAALFYARLFEIEPTLRPLFRGDLTEQGRKLMQMLGAAVAGLDRVRELAPRLRELGRRHHEYGVRDVHYETVAVALLWTLEQGLGERFTAEVRDAWTKAYHLMADAMKAGASVRAAA
jgi:hemoglobin-like flavoprotein